MTGAAPIVQPAAAVRVLPIAPQVAIALVHRTGPRAVTDRALQTALRAVLPVRLTLIDRAIPNARQRLPRGQAHVRGGATAVRPDAPRSGERPLALGHGTAPATFIALIVTDMRAGGIIVTGTIVTGIVAGG